MQDVRPGGRLGRSVRSLASQASEVVHIAAVYLGIAVLVTVALSVIVPTLREQSVRLYSTVLLSLRPADLGEAGADPALVARLAQEQKGAPGAAPSASAPDASTGEGSRQPHLVPRTFSEALEALDSFSVPGVSKAQSQALRSYIARKYRIAPDVAGVLIQTVYTVGGEKNMDPLLLLAVIAIESRYNPFAQSHVGAQGLMQVMTEVHRDKFDGLEEGSGGALNPIANIRVGTQILYDCIKRRGSVTGGLACYVGATGPSDGGYGAKVLAERRRLSLASGIAPGPY